MREPRLEKESPSVSARIAHFQNVAIKSKEVSSNSPALKKNMDLGSAAFPSPLPAAVFWLRLPQREVGVAAVPTDALGEGRYSRVVNTSSHQQKNVFHPSNCFRLPNFCSQLLTKPQAAAPF